MFSLSSSPSSPWHPHWLGTVLLRTSPLASRRVASNRVYALFTLIFRRVLVLRYTGASNSVNGGSATGGGGINLIKILDHNGTSFDASLSLFPFVIYSLLTRFFVIDQALLLELRRPAMLKVERAGIGLRTFNFYSSLDASSASNAHPDVLSSPTVREFQLVYWVELPRQKRRVDQVEVLHTRALAVRRLRVWPCLD